MITTGTCPVCGDETDVCKSMMDGPHGDFVIESSEKCSRCQYQAEMFAGNGSEYIGGEELRWSVDDAPELFRKRQGERLAVLKRERLKWNYAPPESTSMAASG